MTPLECPRIDELLDLYAAGECEEADKEVVRRHVAGCRRCAAELERAREVSGLLDLHFCQDEGLARLERKLRQQVRLPARRWSRPEVTRPLLSLAAMLLVTVGLGLWLSPADLGREEPAPLVVSLVQAPDLLQAMPAAVRGMDAVKFAAPKDAAIEADLGGKSPAEWEKAVRKGEKTGRPPLPPRVPLRISLRNSGPQPLHVEIGGRSFDYRLQLSGPRVVRLQAGEKSPVNRHSLTIPPGGEAGLPWERLIAVENGKAEYFYPLAPGEYQLRITVRALAWKDGQRARAVWLRGVAPLEAVTE